MANIDIFIPKLIKHEGGYVNHPRDKGGATKYGVTLNTWKDIGYDKDNNGIIDSEDIKLLAVEDFKLVAAKYWNLWKADEIVNQSVAELLVDWVYTSGKWGIIIPQRLLKVTADGIVGPKTLNALNRLNQSQVFEELFRERKMFFESIVKNNPGQKVFLKGWLNRLNTFKFTK